MEEKNNNKLEENCSLCDASKQVIDKLNLNQSSEIKSSRSFWRSRTMVWSLVIILGAFAGYKFLLSSPPGLIQGNNPEQSAETVLAKPQIGYFAPDFISEDVYGTKITLSNFRGKKPVLLVFWATWCSVCDQELPYLKAFFEANKDELVVFGVVSGEAKWAVKSYIKKYEINFPILLDNKRNIWKNYLVRGTPSHFLIDIDGKIIASVPGFASEYDLMMFQSLSY